MKYKFITISLLTLLSVTSCKHDDWLHREPKNIITNEQLWNDPVLITSVVANLYDRIPNMHGVFNTGGMTEIDDAMWSGHRDQNWRNDLHYGDDYGRYWDYTLIRDINLNLDNIEEFSVDIDPEQKELFKAEMRFVRAMVYFEMVKRMGGVPLVTTQLIHEIGGDPSPLQIPRAKEHEVYDFVYNELEEIKEVLGANSDSRTRANTVTALALQSRAMLYAASIAKYNALMGSPISTPGGEVGIPASMANDYYTKSLNASKEILSNGNYGLYNANADKGANFYDMLNGKNNDEVIFAKDFKLGVKTHWFTYENIVKSFTEDNEATSVLSPSLSFIESFDYLDGSKGTLRIKNTSGDYIRYESPADLFADKDGRLSGTVIYPGSNFKGREVSMQAGIAVWENGRYQLRTSPVLGSQYEYKDENGATQHTVWTGLDGPMIDAQDVSNTGFYIRKFVSDAAGASARGIAAENWWPWFRMGEIYLNAAEAAFELGQSEALSYINTLRERAGFEPNSIQNLTIDIIRNERRVELAFEDHRFFDLKRWRIAHLVWNGAENNSNAVVHGLYSYQIVRPGHADHGKYIFETDRPTRFRRARLFRMANYYASIDQTVLNNNPKLVRNPFH